MNAIHAARRAYELGRTKLALVRAALVFVIVAVTGVALLGRASVPWALFSAAFAAFAEWRGGLLAKGARRGLLAGWVTLLLPMSVLRPCCANGAMRIMADGTCCTMPSMCGLSGVAVGLLLALSLSRSDTARGNAQLAVGAAFGALSVGAVRCSGLFAGEVAGLLGGLAAGVVVWASGRVLAGLARTA